MSGTRRDFLRQVGSVGGYRATYLTMQAMGLLGTAAMAEPLTLQKGEAHRTKVVILGAGVAGLSAAHPDGPFYFAGEHLSHVGAWQKGAILSAKRAINMVDKHRRAQHV